MVLIYYIMELTSLPDVIFSIIQTFLSKDDYHYLMNTSKYYFERLKIETIYFFLSRKMREIYLLDNDFQEKLLRKVKDGWKQIGISFPIKLIRSSLDLIPNDLPLHTVTFQAFNSIPVSTFLQKFRNVQTITIPNGKLTKLPDLPNTQSLTLSRCEELIDASNLSHLTHLTLSSASSLQDIHPLQDIPSLSLSGCDKILDFTMLGRKQTFLSLNRCNHLTTVENFRNVRVLQISNCFSVTDISSLHGVHDLTLIRCPGIQDISGLGNHYRLKIESTMDLIGYDSLACIPHVSLSGCNISDVSVLQYAKTISLAEVKRVQDLSWLKNVKVVNLSSLNSFCSVGELKDIPHLIIHSRHAILSKFRNHRLDVHINYNSFPDFAIFSKVQHLSLKIISRLPTPPPKFVHSDLLHLKDAQSVQFKYFNSLFHVKGLGKVPSLQFISCHDLNDISDLGDNRSVLLEYCSKVEDVSSLATVPIVTIKNCIRVKDCSAISNVPRLKYLEYTRDY